MSDRAPPARALFCRSGALFVWCLEMWCLAMGLAAAGSAWAAEDWPRFRGPNGGGINAGAALPVEFELNQAHWQIELAGSGHSSPVIWDDKLYATSYGDGQQWTLECFDKSTGKLLWNWSRPLPPHPMHRLNGVASSTPAVDARGVYALAAEAEHFFVVAIDHSGRELWIRDLGRWVAQHGFGTSPVVFENRIYFFNSQEPVGGQPEPSELICLDAATGRDLWRRPISGERACYATPAFWQNPAGEWWLIGSTQGEGVFAVDPAQGEIAWQEPLLKQRTVGSPLVVDNQVIANNGSGGGGNYLVNLALAPDSRHLKYELHQSIGYVPTPLALDGRLYICADNGIVSCYRLADGESLWRQRVSDGFWASPVSDGQTVFCVDKNGNVFAIRAGDEYALLGKSPLGEASQATPAISQGRIYFRTLNRLICF